MDIQLAIIVTLLWGFSCALANSGEAQTTESATQKQAKLRGLLQWAARSLKKENVTAHAPHLNEQIQINSMAVKISENFFDEIMDWTGGMDQDVDPIATKRPVDFMIIMDSSASIGSDNFLKMKRIISKWIDILDSKEFETGRLRVGLLSFSEPDKVEAHISFSENLSKKEIIDELHRAQYHGGQHTSTEVALWRAVKMFNTNQRESGRVLLLATDGLSDNPLKLPFGVLWPAAILRQKLGVFVFAIGIGDQVNHNELRAIANKPSSDHIFEPYSYAMMEEVMKKLQEAKSINRDLAV